MPSGPPRWITSSYDLSFLQGITLTLGTLWSLSWRKVPAEWWCICSDSKFHRFYQYETNFYNQFPALGIFTSCQDINLICDKIQTCHNLWLGLLMGDFTPPPECQEGYIESTEQVQESSPKLCLLQKPRSFLLSLYESQRSNPWG